MLAQTSLVLSLATAALATYSPQHLKNIRALHISHDVLEVRQATAAPSTATGTSTGGLDGLGCQFSAYSLLSSVPTPTGSLESYLLSAVTQAPPAPSSIAIQNATALCQATASLPSSLRADYSSYDAAVSSWYSAHSSELSALASSCSNQLPVAPATLSAILSYATAPNPCSGIATATGSGNGTASPTSSNGSGNGSGESGSSPSSSVSVGGAARPTGVVAGAAVAAAGFLGAAVLL
ncbi:hypothetical protein F5B20DRAFT_548530 [Whalleya microplaca]|nr:hypothetical protein F5B20DRAFT_548530 [Whalleya microplaca]